MEFKQFIIQDMKKIGFLQFDERVDDDNIKTAIEINRKYCELHGYDYIFKTISDEDLHHDLDDYLIDDRNKFKISIYDYRVKMIEQYMNDYDYLVYCDSDAVVYNPSINIEDLIDDDHGLFLFKDAGETIRPINILDICIAVAKVHADTQYVGGDIFDFQYNDKTVIQHFEDYVSNSEGFASGFLIVKCKSDLLKHFIEDFHRFYPLFENSLCDQGCITALLRRRKYKDFYKVLDISMHGNPFLAKNLKYLKQYSLYNETCFIAHFYGYSKYKEETAKYLEEIKQNQYWKGVFN